MPNVINRLEIFERSFVEVIERVTDDMAFDPAKHTFKIYRGATFRKIITLYEGEIGTSAPQDLTLFEGVFVIKTKAGSDGEELLSSPDDITITLGGVDGTIEVEIPATTTSDLTWKSAHYSLAITLLAEVDLLLIGTIKVIDT